MTPIAFDEMDKAFGTRRTSKLIDIRAEARAETQKAFQLYDGKRTAWVPKSQVEDNGDGTFTMPDWLALNSGFI
jgi:hypothetical protein